MKINENKLAIYERNPEKYREEIKAMDKRMWDEWDEEYKQRKQFVTPDMTTEQFIRKCEEGTKQAKLMTRVIRLKGKVDKIEHYEWLRERREKNLVYTPRPVAPAPKPEPQPRRRVVISNDAATLIQAAEQYEMQLYLKRSTVIGKA